VVDEPKQRERHEDREQSGSDGQECCDEPAKDPQGEHEEQRESDRLGAHKVTLGRRPHLLVRDLCSAHHTRQGPHEPPSDGTAARRARLEPGGNEDEPPMRSDRRTRRDERDRRLTAQPRRRDARVGGRGDDEDRRAWNDARGARQEILCAEAL
jgi:hypothetical protein